MESLNYIEVHVCIFRWKKKKKISKEVVRKLCACTFEKYNPACLDYECREHDAWSYVEELPMKNYCFSTIAKH